MSSVPDNSSRRSSRVRVKTKIGNEYEVELLRKRIKRLANVICKITDTLEDAISNQDSIAMDTELKRLGDLSNDVDAIKKRLTSLEGASLLESMIQDAETVIMNAQYKVMAFNDGSLKSGGTDKIIHEVVAYSNTSAVNQVSLPVLKTSLMEASLPPPSMRRAGACFLDSAVSEPDMTDKVSLYLQAHTAKDNLVSTTEQLEAMARDEGHIRKHSLLRTSSIAASLPPPNRRTARLSKSGSSISRGTHVTGSKVFSNFDALTDSKVTLASAVQKFEAMTLRDAKVTHLEGDNTGETRSQCALKEEVDKGGSLEKPDFKVTPAPPEPANEKRSSMECDNHHHQDGYREPLQPSSSSSTLSEQESVTSSRFRAVSGTHNRLLIQMKLLEKVLPTYDEDMVKANIHNVDRALSDLVDSNGRLIEVLSNEEDQAHQAGWMAITDDAVFTLKQQAYDILLEHQKPPLMSTKYSSRQSSIKSRSSAASVKQRAKTAGLRTEAEHLVKTKGDEIKAEVKRKEEAINDRLTKLQLEILKSEACEKIYHEFNAGNVPPVASIQFREVSSAHNRLLMQMKKLEKVLLIQDEQLVKTNLHNVDSALIDLVVSNRKMIEALINKKDQAHQASWMEKINNAVFCLKQQAYDLFTKHKVMSVYTPNNEKPSTVREPPPVNRKSASIDGSTQSRSSTASVKQRVKTASLRAEAELLSKTKGDKIKAEAKKKEDEINDTLNKLQLEIAKSEACEKIYNKSDVEHAPPLPRLHNSTIKKPHIITESLPASLGGDGTAKHGEQLVDLIKLIKAPSVDIDPFTGNPLEFEYFRSNFKEVVESTVSDQRGRMMRLIKYTTGEAKELIKPCIHLMSGCYDTAMALLEAEYGSSTHITELYIKQLQEWPSVKLNDAAGLKSFYRFLLRCKTYQRDTKLLELNSSCVIRSVILKLHSSYYEKWSTAAEKIHRKEGRQPKFDDLVDFVDFHSSRANNPAFSVDILNEARKSQIKSSSTLQKQGLTNQKESEESIKKQASAQCPVCNNIHDIETCVTYNKLELAERIKLLRKLKLCYGCLTPIGKDHIRKSCAQKRTCSTCNQKHPTTLHDPIKGTKVPTSGTRTIAGAPETPSVTTEAKKISSGSTHYRSEDKYAISLCVIPVLVSHKNFPEKETMVYALLDDGCTGCLGLPSLLEALAPGDIERAHVSIDTVHGSTDDLDGISLEGLIVRGINADAERVHLPKTYNINVVPASEEEVPTPKKIRHWGHLKEVHDSIPEFNNDIPFALIIGSNCPKANEPMQVIPCENDGPRACKTRLGWCVIGPIGTDNEQQKNPAFRCSHIKLETSSPSQYITVKDISTGEIKCNHFKQTTVVSDLFISDKLKEMYDNEFNEDKGDECSNSTEDDTFLRIMDTHASREEGHFVLPLPFRQPKIPLPNNHHQVEQRLASLRKRLCRDESFCRNYNKFMEKIINNNHAEQCEHIENDLHGKLWYLPHHGVVHRSKKFRGVFDCSAELNGRSLNKELLQGPDLTNSLCGVLIRFREHKTAVMADIEAMFFQVRIPKHQRSYQRFLWWPNGDLNGNPVEYEMKVHMFGTISSPSCANYALRKTAIENRDILGDEAANTLLKNFYVDDMLKSVDSVLAMVLLVQALYDMCRLGGFNLTKFVSNSKEVLESIPLERRASSVALQDLTKTLPIERALGVVWCVENDSLGFRISPQDAPLTRRGILSTISSIFDPLGLAAPFILRGRKILQEITCDGSGWDDPVSDIHAARWAKWREELPLLNDIEVNRCYKTPEFSELLDASTHNFGDASNIGYGTAIYLRLVDTKGKVTLTLVKGKSRVSPISKPVTIPRLELTAAVLNAREGFSVKKELDLKVSTETYYTDSMVTLGYIRNESRRFRLFVANRGKAIRQLTRKEQWQYIPSKENPADDASKGISLRDTDKVKRWFEGPIFLHEHDYKTGQEVVAILEDIILAIPDNDPEVKTHLTINAVEMHGESCHDLLSRLENLISTWEKMTHIMAIILAFCQRCKTRESCSPFTLSTSCIKHAEATMFKMIQARDLEPEINILKKTKESLVKYSKKERRGVTKLWMLDPFVDETGILKVGGRFRKSFLDEATKHPVILPKSGLAVKLLVEHIHMRVQHCGRTTTMNALRGEGYWIIGASSLVRHVISHCIKCRKYRGKLGEQKMADLPDVRTPTVPPFTHCGLDSFGPFTIKEGRKQVKRFVSLFTCMSSRAVHMETTVEMTTDSFILSLRRFLARRGPVDTITSDNGKNFVGAENEFRKAYDEMDHTRINRFLVSHTCDWIVWKKTPPNASHMGGVWERQIRTIRSILTSLLKEHSSALNDESFRTLLSEAETIVNSRPLIADSLSDASIEPLTPNHLLTTKCKPVLPPPGIFQKKDSYCRRRWRHVQYLSDIFWNRWRKEYLSSLQIRQKWTDPKRNFQVGDIVLVKENNIPRQQWPLAKVVDTFPDSSDGMVRSVNLKIPTAISILKRPIHKIALILENEE